MKISIARWKRMLERDKVYYESELANIQQRLNILSAEQDRLEKERDRLETLKYPEMPSARHTEQDLTEDGVVRDYLLGDKAIVIQLEYKISPGAMYRILHARKVKLRKAEAEEVEGAVPTEEVKVEVTQHPLFSKYRREFLHEATGYSEGYLCRVANGKTALSRAFVERVCFNLHLPEDELFFPEAGLSPVIGPT